MKWVGKVLIATLVLTFLFFFTIFERFLLYVYCLKTFVLFFYKKFQCFYNTKTHTLRPKKILLKKERGYFTRFCLLYLYKKPNHTSYQVLTNFLEKKILKKEYFALLIKNILWALVVSTPIKWLRYVGKVKTLVERNIKEGFPIEIEMLYIIEASDIPEECVIIIAPNKVNSQNTDSGANN